MELDGEWMVMGVEGPILFPVIRDGHKPNSGALMSIIRIPVIEGGLSLSRYKELIDPGTYEDRRLELLQVICLLSILLKSS